MRLPALLGLPEGDGWGRAQWSAGGPRVYRVYPNPNPKLRVPELSGSDFSELKSGSIFYYPNFVLPELPDPKNSGNPNAQSYLRYSVLFFVTCMFVWCSELS